MSPHYHSCAKTSDGQVAVVGGFPRIDGLSKCEGEYDDYFVELEFFDPQLHHGLMVHH